MRSRGRSGAGSTGRTAADEALTPGRTPTTTAKRSWFQIDTAPGITRQAAQQRYGRTKQAPQSVTHGCTCSINSSAPRYTHLPRGSCSDRDRSAAPALASSSCRSPSSGHPAASPTFLAFTRIILARHDPTPRAATCGRGWSPTGDRPTRPATWCWASRATCGEGVAVSDPAAPGPVE